MCFQLDSKSVYEDLAACVTFNATIALCLFWMVTVGFEWLHGQRDQG